MFTVKLRVSMFKESLACRTRSYLISATVVTLSCDSRVKLPLSAPIAKTPFGSPPTIKLFYI